MQNIVVTESAAATHDVPENAVCPGQRQETSIFHSLTHADSKDSTTTKHDMKISLVRSEHAYLKPESEKKTQACLNSSVNPCCGAAACLHD